MINRMTSISKSRNQRNNLMNVYRRPQEGNKSTIKYVSLVLVVTTLYAAFLYQSGAKSNTFIYAESFSLSTSSPNLDSNEIFFSGGAGSFSGSKDTSSMFANNKKTLAVTTWNIAAINNNVSIESI